MRLLTLARRHVGAGALAFGKSIDPKAIAQGALEHLKDAIGYFRERGMDPWVAFSLVQAAKGFADLHSFDEAMASIDQAAEGLEWFPVLASHVFEAEGQVRGMRSDAQASESFKAAAKAAQESGLQKGLRRWSFT